MVSNNDFTFMFFKRSSSNIFSNDGEFSIVCCGQKLKRFMGIFIMDIAIAIFILAYCYSWYLYFCFNGNRIFIFSFACWFVSEMAGLYLDYACFTLSTG